MTTDRSYDVIIMGAGIAGSILASIFAHKKLKVAMIDAGTHPRMAIGESTIPLESSLLRVLAARYDIPELLNLTSFAKMKRFVSRSNGIKTNFGFVMHHEGYPIKPEETHQVVIPKMLDTEHHLFRQDVDSYLHITAIRYGAETFQNVRINEIETDQNGVYLKTTAGNFTGRYLCDASGYHSPVAKKFGLRQNPPRNLHHSRGLFTHMVGVTPFDNCLPPNRQTKQPRPWHQGTLHHIFDGGWMWVIPFNNFKGSNNQLTSVGFLLDPRRYPKPTGHPEAEFRSILARFPDMATQFLSAKAVRPWVSSDRIQFSSHSMFLDRIGLTAHASGFVDALFSQGLPITLATINLMAQRVIDACRDNNFTATRFAQAETVAQAMIDRHDKIIYASFIGFGHFALWDAVLRVWALNAFLSTFYSESLLRQYRRTQNPDVFSQFEVGPCFGAPIPFQLAYDNILEQTVAACQQVSAGTMPAETAGKKIIGLLQESKIVPPAFGLDHPKTRYFNATPLKMLKTLWWSHTDSDPQVGIISRHALKNFVHRKVIGA